MFKRIDLARQDWRLAGWEAEGWRYLKAQELAGTMLPDIGPVPARVPGSVHEALRLAGRLPDWNVGVNSRQAGWVESRHWEFSTTLPGRWLAGGQPARLCCAGLDHAGVILVDGQEAGSFEGGLLPHAFDLSQWLTPGADHVLSILFTGAPDEQGMFGWTSRSRHFKARFAYQWDWCPRIVPLGPWDDIMLEIGEAPRIVNVRRRPALDEDLRTGRLTLECKLRAMSQTGGELRATLSRHGKPLAEVRRALRGAAGEAVYKLKFEPLAVEPWQPNGEGEPVLYDAAVEVLDAEGAPIDAWRGRVGFKRVRWLPCQDAPKGALPWICEVNGTPIFLQGVNWTPIRPNYQELKRVDYARRLTAYHKMGCNLMRVWGGGLIEKRDFYELCDELGILVWQEFPLSSSVFERVPPSDPDVIARLVTIAESAIERRGGHACHLMWCGGNELAARLPTPEAPDLEPCDAVGEQSHPCLAALRETVRRLDPGVRFLPTTPYGAAFMCEERWQGKGVQHDVHGPWNMAGSYAEWEAFWRGDDALFHAETGMPGAQSLELLRKYRGELPLWPPTMENELWRHSSSWWLQWERFKDELPGAAARDRGDAAIARYVKLSQALQARALGCMARAAKRRFPRCGGLLIWMGHDCFPCPVNTSVLDFDGRPKPAARALGRVFRAKPEDL